MASPGFTLTASFLSPTGPSTGYLKITLTGYGTQIPRVVGTGTFAPISYSSAIGSSVSVTLYGNDQITPTNATYYLISQYNADGTPILLNVPYQLGGASGDLSSLTPLSPTPPTIQTFPTVGAASALGIFSIPSLTWTLTHNMGTQAVVAQCYDTNWHQIIPDTLTHTDINTTTATFLQNQAGYLVVENVGTWAPSVTSPVPIITTPNSTQTILGAYPFTVQGPTTISSSLTVSGAATLSSSLGVSGAVTINDGLTATGDNPTVLGGSLTAPRVNGVRVVDGVKFTTIQAALADLGGPGKVFVPAGTYTTSTQITLSDGQTLEATPCGHSEASSTLCGAIVQWTGATNTPVILIKDASHVRVLGINVDCNSVSGCIGYQSTSDNSPSQSYLEIGFCSVNNAHHAFTFGDDSDTPSTNNYQADIAWLHDFSILGTGADTTSEGIRINSQNAVDQCTIERANIQQVSIPYHQIKGPLQTLIVRHVNVGSPIGAKTAFQMDSSNCIGPVLEGCEVEGNWTNCVVDHSTCSEVLMTAWIGNQFNQPGAVLVDGNQKITSIGNSGGNANTWTIGGSAFVHSIMENFTQWTDNGLGQLSAVDYTTGFLAMRTPYVWASKTIVQGGVSANLNVGYYATGTPGIGTGTSQISFDANNTFTASATSSGVSFQSAPATAASAFTMSSFDHFKASDITLGGGSAVTTQVGFHVSTGLSHGTNNYAFKSEGTTQSALGGPLKIGDQGSCTMTAGTCAAQNLVKTYTTAPNCVATWNGSGTLTGILKVPSTTTTVTPASSVNTDTAVVNWICFGN